MNISPVSFRSTVGTTQRTNFDALISRPQTFAHTEQPTAATNIAETKKKKSPLKKLLGLIVTAGAVAAGLALGAKKGVFNPKANGNKYVETAKSGCKIAGEYILEKGKQGATIAKTKFNEIKGIVKEKISELAKAPKEEMVEEVTEAGEEILTDLANKI